MNKKDFTAEALLTRWEIRREVQNIMGKYSQSYCIKQEGALPQFWSKRDDISLGLNEGYYIGQDAVKGYYAAIEAETKLASKLIAARFPKKLEDKTEEELFGVGQVSYRPIDTAVVEVADDLQSAKGLWVVRGLVERVTTAGPVSFWDFSYWAVDFILEDGAWKILHMLDLHEVDSRQGINLTDTPEPLPEDPAFAEMATVSIPAPTRPCPLRETYGADRPFTPSPRVPEPYKTLAETFSYGA
jgi:hypothetical protein